MYDTDLFKAARIHQLQAHLERLLSSMVEWGARPLSQLPMLSDGEINHLVHGLNDTACAYPQDALIHTLFEAQVEKTPDATAVVFEGESLSYSELNTRANQLSDYLVTTRQVGPDSLVGICVERSMEMVVGILGILKAGGAYVPLDPAYPSARLEYMIEDAKLTTIVTHEAIDTDIPITAAQRVDLDSQDIVTQLQQCETQNRKIEGLESTHLAYVIYTSGSTGKPKGVMVEHCNTVALLSWAHQCYGPDKLKCVLASTSICFDLSVFECFAPLLVGGEVVIVQNILELPNLVNSECLTLINTVPSAAESLLNVSGLCFDNKVINLAGEPLKQHLVDKLYDAGFMTVNDLYGPSEDTTYSTFVTRIYAGSMSIGKPIANTQCYVLNNMSLAPFGATGELYISGAGVARGYLNDPELTADKFIDNPYYNSGDANSFKRLYKTGDIVRYLPNGNLKYIGRTDYQVKIRGFRIELGEIEQQLLSYSDIENVTVVASSLEGGAQCLVAYVTHTDAVQINADEDRLRSFVDSLRDRLARDVPSYMVPAAFILLQRLPLTPNGKIDRATLPAPSQAFQKNSRVEPTTEIERSLCNIWKDVLGVEQLGITDNFFDLGGHSLLILPLVKKLVESNIPSLEIQDLYQGKNIQQIARSIDEKRKAKKSHTSTVVNLNHSQTAAKIFAIHPILGHVDPYKELAHVLREHATVYGIQSPCIAGEEFRFNSMLELAQLYLNDIRAVQPKGPYRIMGWSAGGLIAFYLIHLIQQQGDAVEYYMNLDSEVPFEGMKLTCKQSLFYFVEQLTFDCLSEQELKQVKLQIEESVTEQIAIDMCAEYLQTSGKDIFESFKFNKLILQAGTDYFSAERPVVRLDGVARTDIIVSKNKPEKDRYEASWRERIQGYVDFTRVPACHEELLEGDALKLAIGKVLEDLTLMA
ncbi:D-alanine--D-alanyl carrier protein ligase [Pseudoalteromonas sp. CIP111854]|uniref:D-alanine--D-alanyl carrier protein ligase n=1 Tax=Pseudoalteromonas holothuriae TaxID=2963714 RepID=A0A9W4QZH2_9GAMM|nr:D-alanine--D-alanyl carrier protein ligase [Pseudoalteromonas sp. CIP111854]